MQPTDIQKSIIAYDGNAVVMASPGSGKTFVLSNMIRRILKDEKVLPFKGVIAISYTRKASANLKNRVLENTGIRKNSFFGTIDNFCLTQIVQEFGDYVFGHPSKGLEIISIVDLQQDCKKFEWIKVVHPDYHCITSNQIADLTDLFKMGKVLVESLELLALHILLHCPACQTYIKARYEYILIDEFQDTDTYTNQLFLKLVDMGLIGVAVGDEHQSIFGFAHKNCQYLQNLNKNPDFKSFVLSDNFRCSLPIINYSNRILDSNSNLVDTKDKGVTLVRVNGDESMISKYIDQCIKGISQDYGIKNYSDIAILVKNKNTQNIINNTLQTPHRIVDTTQLDVDLSPRSRLFTYLLRFYFDRSMPFFSIINEYIDYDNLRVYERKRLNEESKKIRSVTEGNIMDLSQHFDTVADIFFPKIGKGTSLQKLNNVLRDKKSMNMYKPVSKNEIQIMTLHKSKGLEFDLVFHLNLNEWEFPSKKFNDSNCKNADYCNWNQDLDLHYVGITRARKACILIKNSKRTQTNGKISNSNDSEFLNMHNLASLREEIVFKENDLEHVLV